LNLTVAKNSEAKLQEMLDDLQAEAARLDQKNRDLRDCAIEFEDSRDRAEAELTASKDTIEDLKAQLQQRVDAMTELEEKFGVKETRAQCYETFYGRNLIIFVISCSLFLAGLSSLVQCL
jgi:hypothetical protein